MTRFPAFNLSRRQFLASSGAAGLVGFPAMSQTPQIIRPMPGRAQLGPDGTGMADIWGYDGRVPGPTFRVKQGERLRVRLENGLDQATTIHWHGIRIDNAMDGVAHLTQAPVAPDGGFDYDFIAPDAGTFWYHPHNRTWEQMARGLYGALIVEEAVPPQVDRDMVMVLDDWRLDQNGALDDASFGDFHDWAHGGRLGNWPSVNGKPQPAFDVAQNERIRLRLINAANASILSLRLDGMDATIVAYDGQPVVPEQVAGDLIIAPSQRIDIIADVTAADQARLMLSGREDFLAASFPVTGVIKRLVALGPVQPLPENPLPKTLATEGAQHLNLVMAGGAMRWMAEAEVGGRMTEHGGDAALPAGRLPGMELAKHNLFWSLNGTAGMPDAPLFSAPAGQTVRMTMINDTMFPHAMHLHGHHFLDIRTGQWRDTVLSNPGENREIAFVADNPGDWMLHCHMLEHQASGMSTWFRVG